jgi:uncharacterized membrane protein
VIAIKLTKTFFLLVAALFFAATIFSSYDYVAHRKYIDSVFDLWLLAAGFFSCLIGYILTKIFGAAIHKIKSRGDGSNQF